MTKKLAKFIVIYDICMAVIAEGSRKHCKLADGSKFLSFECVVLIML